MAEPGKKLITVLVPVYNEEKNIEPLYKEFKKAWRGLEERYDYELIFNDNHSADKSFEILEKLAGEDDRVRIFRFSKNFGNQRSIYAGYIKARGEAVIELDCDLQDPPEMIAEFIGKWEQGYQVVYGVRSSREEAWWINALRKTFYRLINLLSEDELPLDTGDFRLVDRRIIEELKKSVDLNPYLRGAIAAMGFNQVGIPYQRSKRKHGESNIPARELVGIAMDGILNHSIFPLRLATYVGILTLLAALITFIVYAAGSLILHQTWPSGFSVIALLIFLALGANAVLLGITGEYLGRIYRQVKGQSLTIIEREIPPELGRPEQDQSGKNEQ
jgi:dolichol-phosphate mannosyltransferase